MSDHAPMVLKKHKAPEKDTVPKAKGKIPSDETIRLHKIEEEGIGHVEHVDINLAKTIQNARKEKNLTQDDLNKKCNFPPHTVKNYENGSAIPKQSELSQMSKHLGVVLKKPKVKKEKS